MTDSYLEFDRTDFPISETARASMAQGEASPPLIPPESPRPLAALAVSTLVVASVVVTAALGGRSLASRIAGMSSLEFHRDLIVATSAIAIHLSLDRFLHRVVDSLRTLRTGSSKRDRRPAN